MSGSQVHHPHAVTFLVTSSQLQETMPCALCTQADSPEGSAGLRGVRRAPRRGRPRTAWTDNIKTWTGLPVKESVRMTEDRDKRRKYVSGVVKPRIANTAKEQNRTEPRNCHISRSCCCWPPPRSDSTTVRTSSRASRGSVGDDRSHVITSTPRLFNDSYSDDVAGQSVGGALCDRTLTVALLTSTATNHGTSTAHSTHVMRLQRRRPGSAARGRGQRAEGHVPTGQHSLHPRPDLPHVLGIRYVAACSGVAGNFFPRGAKLGDLGDKIPQVGFMGNLVIITYKILTIR